MVSKRWQQRGRILETQLLLAAYGILVALFFPPLYRNYPAGVGVIWLIGLGLAKFYCDNLLDDAPRKVLAIPIYVWAYLLLSAVPAFCLWEEFPPGALFMVVQPYLAMRVQLRATPTGPS